MSRLTRQERAAMHPRPHRSTGENPPARPGGRSLKTLRPALPTGNALRREPGKPEVSQGDQNGFKDEDRACPAKAEQYFRNCVCLQSCSPNRSGDRLQRVEGAENGSGSSGGPGPRENFGVGIFAVWAVLIDTGHDRVGDHRQRDDEARTHAQEAHLSRKIERHDQQERQ